jgi:hypothetical protein
VLCTAQRTRHHPAQMRLEGQLHQLEALALDALWGANEGAGGGQGEGCEGEGEAGGRCSAVQCSVVKRV